MSIGSTLLDQGMRTHAIKVFASVESLLRDAERPALRSSLAVTISERGFALKQEAWASSDESLMEGSILAFTELERMFGQELGEPFEQLVAFGIYNKAGALGALGRLDEATMCFKQVISTYRDSPNAIIQEVVAFATIRERMMVAVPDLPPYIEVPMPDTEYEWLVKDVRDLKQVAWFMEEDPEKKRAMVEALGAAASKSHRSVREILTQHRIKAFPFALLLRSFDAEGFSSMTGPRWSAETGLEPWAISAASTEPSHLERELAKAVGSDNPVLAVANKNSLLYESAWIVPRLFLSYDGWKPTVEALIRTAHIIVIGIEDRTPSIRWELECIKRHGRTDSTLVVLAPQDDWTAIRRAMREAANLDQEFAPATKESAELAGFERVIAENEIPMTGLASVSALRDLLQDMQATAGLDPEGRVRHLARLVSSSPDISSPG